MPRSIAPVHPSGRRRPGRAGAAVTGLLLALALTAAGCGGDETATDTGAAPDGADAATASADDSADASDGSGEAMEDEGSGEGTTDGGGSEDAAGMSELLALELTDVDGATFTLADYAGTPIMLENFATWCPTCRGQLQQNQQAAAASADEAAFVALSTETDLDPADVAAYAADNGFDDIRFAVLTPEQLAFFSDTYGNSAINPPSTPHWFISADGAVGEMVTGGTGADAIPGLLGL